MTPPDPTPSGHGGLPRHPRGAARPHGDEDLHVGGQVPNDSRHPRVGRGSAPGLTPRVGHQPRGVPRHPRGAANRRLAGTPEAGNLASSGRLDPHEGAALTGHSGTGPSDVDRQSRGADCGRLTVRLEVHLLAGEAGRALAAAQGCALSALLASVAEVEVGQGEEVSP
jgi:hypothetical protein